VRPTIYTIAHVLYPRPMPARPSGNVKYGVSITVREATVLEAERRRRGVRYLSAVMHAALRELLEGADFERRPLPLPTSRGEPMVAKKFQLPPGTIASVKETARLHRYTEQQIVRAAIYEMERRAESSGQGPTQTGR